MKIKQSQKKPQKQRTMLKQKPQKETKNQIQKVLLCPRNQKHLTVKNKSQKQLPLKKMKLPLLLGKEHQAVQSRDYIFNIL